MRALTISQLEEASGVPRSTIYFYVREGLLPVAQKAAASRAVYADSYLDLLREIAALKDEGLSLEAIKERLSGRIATAGAFEVDLVAERAERVKQSILAAAARLFARKGYKRTRVVDIIKEAGITPPVFYDHFVSKQQLFLEAFGVLAGWMSALVEDRLSGEPDWAARQLTRVQGYFGFQTLSPDLMALARSEALHEAGEMREAVERSYKAALRGTAADLERMRIGSGTKLPAAAELVAFGLLGSVEDMVMRASWDRQYSTSDVLWSALCLFLAVEALYTGQLDVSARLATYVDRIEQLTAAPPVVPPEAGL
jgi:AcrR family transcriptional regulator